MATAKKLPSGNWRVQAKVTINGKVICKSFTSDTKKQAEILALEWQNNEAANEKSESILLCDAYKRYIDSKENILSPSTIREYRRMNDKVLQSIMNVRIDKLTNEKIQSAINIESSSHSPKTVRNIHGLLSAILAMFRPDFMLHTALPQKKKESITVPEESTILKIINASKGTKLEIPILLAALGPMRRGEICALTSEDIRGNVITVNKSMAHTPDSKWVVKSPKSYAGYREITMPDFVIEKLSGLNGKIYHGSPDSLTLAFRKLLQKNGIPHFRFHDLRHYAVSFLHANGVPDKYIMARGGWKSNYTMNTVYNHAMKDKMAEFDKQISDKFQAIYNRNN